MTAKRIWTSFLAVLFCAILVLTIVEITRAEGGGTRADPLVIATLPYDVTTDSTSFTVGEGDPIPSCVDWERDLTAWYVFTPQTDMLVKAHVEGQWLDLLTLAVYEKDSSGALQEVGCGAGWEAHPFNLTAQHAYFFMAGARIVEYPPYDPPTSTSLRFYLYQLFPPANDNFASAKAITDLPFGEELDPALASVEPGEPMPSCDWHGVNRTLWYSFTPAKTALYAIYPKGVGAVYTGSSLDGLVQAGCGEGEIILRLQAGTPYFIQTIPTFWQDIGGIYLDIAPAPSINFDYTPTQPNAYDVVTFEAHKSDPFDTTTLTYRWDFGDGQTAEGDTASHTFGADGDYTVTLTGTTDDGRSGTFSLVIPVGTQDVSLTALKAPEQFRAGQEYRFEATVENNHYPATVQLFLNKIRPGGESELIGMLQQDVPSGGPASGGSTAAGRGGPGEPGLTAAGRGGTMPFYFIYRFSEKDEALGIESFQAEAILVGANDVRPEDNFFTVNVYQGPNLFKDWMRYNGYWYLNDGWLTSAALMDRYMDLVWIWAGNPAQVFQGDLTASFDLRLSSTDPHNLYTVDSGMMFYASAPTKAWDAPNKGYVLAWKKDPGVVDLSRLEGGEEVSLAASAPLSGPPQHWEVRVNGDKICFFGDGVKLFEARDATYRSGYFGFFATPVTQTEVSRVQIGKKFRSLMKK